MWCDVKKCNHNRNGYCQNKDYISIDAQGKCDSNTVIESKLEKNNQSSEEGSLFDIWKQDREARKKEKEKPKAI